MGDTFLCVYIWQWLHCRVPAPCTHIYMEHAFICTYACMCVHVCLCVCTVCAFVHTVGVCMYVYVLVVRVRRLCGVTVAVCNLFCDTLCSVIVATSGGGRCLCSHDLSLLLSVCLSVCLSPFLLFMKVGVTEGVGQLSLFVLMTKWTWDPLKWGRHCCTSTKCPSKYQGKGVVHTCICTHVYIAV